MTWAIMTEDHSDAIREIIAATSERVVTILGGAMLDDTVHRTLKERLRGDDKDMVNQMLKPTGVIGNAVPKVQVLYLLGAFDKGTKDAMIGLLQVRNFFAHHLAASFNSTDDGLVAPFRKLTLHEGRTYYPHHFFKSNTTNKIEPPSTKQDVFLLNLRMALLLLMQDRVSHHPNTNQPRSAAEIQTCWEAIQPRRLGRDETAT